MCHCTAANDIFSAAIDRYETLIMSTDCRAMVSADGVSKTVLGHCTARYVDSRGRNVDIVSLVQNCDPLHIMH